MVVIWYNISMDAEQRFMEIINNSDCGMLSLNPEGEITFFNKAFGGIVGYNNAEIQNKDFTDIISLSDRTEVRDAIRHIDGRDVWKGTIHLSKNGGDIIPVTARFFGAMNNGSNGYLVILDKPSDYTFDAATTDKYDKTTGLLTRNAFIEHLDKWIAEDIERIKPASLIQMDIDGFRFINNISGHAAADKFLNFIARVIKHTIIDFSISNEICVEEAFVGRLGEDELSIFICSMEEGVALKIAEKVRKRVESSNLPEMPFHSTISIGIANYPLHSDKTMELLVKADAALIHAKKLGRNTCFVYDENQKIIERVSVNLMVKENILSALAQNRFEPWFQPLLNLEKNVINHHEALARLCDLDGSVILPSYFIRTAEESDLIGYIDRVIIEKTMYLQAELAQRHRNQSFSMNLSGKNIGDEQLLEYLKYKISETRADPKKLVFEITETEAIQDFSAAIEFINQLKGLGCKIALDDFGAGFTSFVYLRKMHVDQIKIDGSFIQNLHENKDDRLVVKAIVDVAKGMGITTVAEFVQSDETIKILRDYGVDYAQGYLIGAPSSVLKSRY